MLLILVLFVVLGAPLLALVLGAIVSAVAGGRADDWDGRP